MIPFRAMKRLQFLQMPRLDPDVSTPGENAMLAAACLSEALARSPEAAHWEILAALETQDSGSDRVIVEELVARAPDVLAATCYLWNIERTLTLIQRVRARLPALKVALGGPEIVEEHPLLQEFDGVLSVGEGESRIAPILRAFRLGEPLQMMDRAEPVTPAFALYRSGTRAAMETSRGCPMKCAFCCYNIRRTTLSCLPVAEVALRIRQLREAGITEIRMIDPTFNAHPRFHDLLRVMQAENPQQSIAFFVEIRADTLTDEEAAALAKAGVTEAEVGVQSTDPAVLKIIHRPLDEAKVWRGVAALLRHGIKPTIDFMYGLPAQDESDMQRSLDALARFGDAVHPQFLPTLLLPGTELRARAKELGLVAQSLPPYRVLATDRLTSAQLAAIEAEAVERLGAFDTPTRRFIGVRIPDLFQRRGKTRSDVSGCDSINCRSTCYIDLEACGLRASIRIIEAAVAAEPHILWQFVLRIREELPLDLFERVIEAMQRLPGHWLDRLVSPPGEAQLAARRLFVQLPARHGMSPDWVAAVDDLFARAFH